ncbi:7,8-dihydroneopterin aldolase [Acinetobacter sp. KAM398]|uniref:dihydroneopterin aldolase n=1 Tax=unclassified Acinetobacter TaxID=196816 RepID=UPI001F329325|nr:MULTISPECIES: dihydroneopterin aldolase [unclassified Acinetobacter]GJC31059.1 7,8-dihydroneopterin aldolase [Acinetobacter sp. KAM392]GJC33936.1 7,8-dihydroneopterin aldolase [Acinetobacter sp. KAM393]GJC36765.1 7,8-dihydroneopterin aldolase [Acinetobacter sp. KAM394]GJC39516.1 7,8-dihydroneopterin aldolase [Acinetobacter sp. KAM395]GJC42498.1 7,8-dihydroneopterin aldolase [Acinetobacter sp. KAM396]
MDVIIIEGLKVETVVGCFAWERQIQQPLMLDLIIATNLSQAAASDELQNTLNYAEICSISAQVIQQAAPKLIEHAAQLVVDALFTTFAAIESITITIRKPAIIPEANSVGIRLERHRNDFCPRTGE